MMAPSDSVPNSHPDHHTSTGAPCRIERAAAEPPLLTINEEADSDGTEEEAPE